MMMMWRRRKWRRKRKEGYERNMENGRGEREGKERSRRRMKGMEMMEKWRTTTVTMVVARIIQVKFE